MTLSPARKRKVRRGKEDRKVGSPISEWVGLPADHASSGAWCSVDRAPGGCEFLAPIPLFSKPRSIHSRLPLTLNGFLSLSHHNCPFFS